MVREPQFRHPCDETRLRLELELRAAQELQHQLTATSQFCAPYLSIPVCTYGHQLR